MLGFESVTAVFSNSLIAGQVYCLFSFDINTDKVFHKLKGIHESTLQREENHLQLPSVLLLSEINVKQHYIYVTLIPPVYITGCHKAFFT